MSRGRLSAVPGGLPREPRRRWSVRGGPLLHGGGDAVAGGRDASGSSPGNHDRQARRLGDLIGARVAVPEPRRPAGPMSGAGTEQRPSSSRGKGGRHPGLRGLPPRPPGSTTLAPRASTAHDAHRVQVEPVESGGAASARRQAQALRPGARPAGRTWRSVEPVAPAPPRDRERRPGPVGVVLPHRRRERAGAATPEGRAAAAIEGRSRRRGVGPARARDHRPRRVGASLSQPPGKGRAS
jgi:hypothetical protein